MEHGGGKVSGVSGVEGGEGLPAEWRGVRRRTTKLHQLTKDDVKKAVRKGKTAYDGGGLELRDGKSWVWRYISPKTGKRREKGQGSVEAIDLDVVRDLCKADREL